MILLIWEGAYRLFHWDTRTFPAPAHVLAAAVKMLRSADAQSPLSPMAKAILTSAVRLVMGFSATIIVGTALGLSLSRSAELDRLLGPLFLGLQALPSVCWVPLALLLPGLGQSERGIIFVTVMGSVFAMSLTLRDGLRAIPELYQRAGLMLGAHGWKLYRYILFPASLPALAGGLRLGFSFTWRSLMGAEVLFRAAGLGSLLAAGRSDVAQILAVMTVMVIIGMLADRWLFAILQEKVNARFGLA
jgi:NitT/TauT family transport system permease protein